MSRFGRFALVAVVGMAAAACEGAAVEDGPQAADTASEQPTSGAMGDPQGAAAGGARLAVDTLEGAGPYLTDAQGRALYMLEGEPSDSSTCYDACATEWPPFLAGDGDPAPAAPSVHANLIGTIERRDGARQVTYGGHPLYYYHDDRDPGQTSGQDLTDQWGEWYLVQPSGEHLEEGGA